jgi:hypothetical protein
MGHRRKIIITENQLRSLAENLIIEENQNLKLENSKETKLKKEALPKSLRLFDLKK